MTAERNFKRLVRARMTRTGESYAAARASLERRRHPSPPVGGAMYPFERFTRDAKRALAAAQREATTAGARRIDTGHLLLGVVSNPDGVGSLTLARFGVFEAVVRDRLQAATRHGPDRPIPVSKGLSRVLQLAFDEAGLLGHTHVGDEHIVLGLAGERRGPAFRVLAPYEITIDAARRHVRELALVRTGGTGLPPDAHLSEEVMALLRLATRQVDGPVQVLDLVRAMLEPQRLEAAALMFRDYGGPVRPPDDVVRLLDELDAARRRERGTFEERLRHRRDIQVRRGEAVRRLMEWRDELRG